ERLDRRPGERQVRRASGSDRQPAQDRRTGDPGPAKQTRLGAAAGDAQARRGAARPTDQRHPDDRTTAVGPRRRGAGGDGLGGGTTGAANARRGGARHTADSRGPSRPRADEGETVIRDGNYLLSSANSELLT